MFDYEAARFWLSIAAFLLSAFASVYAWIATRKKAEMDEIKRIDKRLERLEAIIENGPTHTDIRNLHGAIERLIGRMDGINRAVDIINEHLLSRGKA